MREDLSVCPAHKQIWVLTVGTRLKVPFYQSLSCFCQNNFFFQTYSKYFSTYLCYYDTSDSSSIQLCHEKKGIQSWAGWSVPSSSAVWCSWIILKLKGKDWSLSSNAQTLWVLDFGKCFKSLFLWLVLMSKELFFLFSMFLFKCWLKLNDYTDG